MWIGILSVVILGILACWFGPAAINKSDKQGINTLEQIELGGVKQWISIRGSDINNPVLLFLHGGPGSANLSKLRIECPELEEHFVVISWDQRGAGKSALPWFNWNSLTLDQMRQDTHQLTGYLRQKFGGRKIYLMGFSWGTVLGLWTIQDYPEDYLAFISASQVVSFPEGEQLSLAYVQQVAKDTKNQKAIQELSMINPSYESPDWVDQLNKQRKWLLSFGGVYHTANNYNHEIGMLLKASEYSFVDFGMWPINSSKSLKTLYPELMSVDFFNSVKKVEVPTYFLVGRHDYNAPFELTESYYDQLQAPQGKQLIWFKDSAHDLFYDQPEELVKTLIKIKNN